MFTFYILFIFVFRFSLIILHCDDSAPYTFQLFFQIGDSALQIASHNRQIDMVSLLLDSGASLEVANKVRKY